MVAGASKGRGIGRGNFYQVFGYGRLTYGLTSVNIAPTTKFLLRSTDRPLGPKGSALMMPYDVLILLQTEFLHPLDDRLTPDSDEASSVLQLKRHCKGHVLKACPPLRL